jgi:hypothetical protein
MANFVDKGKPKRTQVFVGYQGCVRGLLSKSGVSASTGAGAAPEAEAGALSAVGLHMDPTTDGHDWFWPIPNDMNREHEIGFSVRYSTASATAADDRHFVLLYGIISEDSAMALGSTALSTAIAAGKDNGVANAWQDSARGILNGKIVSEANVAAMDFMALNLVLLLDDAGEEMNMYGLVIDYMPKRGEGHAPVWNAAADLY